MRTVGDLLQHYPRRLAERGELTDLASLSVDDDVTVLAEVISAKTIGPPQNWQGSHRGNKLRVIVEISDGRGTLDLVFFGSRNLWRAKELAPGTRGIFSGRVTLFKGHRQLAHPDYMILHADVARPGAAGGGRVRRGADSGVSGDEGRPHLGHLAARWIRRWPCSIRCRIRCRSRSAHGTP